MVSKAHCIAGYRQAWLLIEIYQYIYVKEELHVPNRGTCDYFVLECIDEIIDKYEAKKEKTDIIEEKDNEEKEDPDIEEER